MALNVAQMAWLNQNTDPVAVMTKALAAKAQQADSELRARSLMQDQQQFAARQALAQAEAQAARDRFLQELALKREIAAQQAQQAINETAFKQGLAERNFGLDAAENDRKAAIASMQFQGQMDYETLVRSGVPPVEALKQTLSKLAVGNPNALASAVNRDEVNFLREQGNENTKAYRDQLLLLQGEKQDAKLEADLLKLANGPEASKSKFLERVVPKLLEKTDAHGEDLYTESEAAAKGLSIWDSIHQSAEVPIPATPVKQETVQEIKGPAINQQSLLRELLGMVVDPTGLGQRRLPSSKDTSTFIVGKVYKGKDGRTAEYIGGDITSPSSWKVR